MRMIVPMSGLCIFFSRFAYCAEPSEESGSIPGVLSSAELIRWSTGLAAVLILILVCAWLLRKLNHFSESGGTRLKILSGLSLSTRERIVLLQVGERQLLVGIAPGRIQTLYILEKGEVARDLTAQSGSSGNPTFAERLRQVVSGD